MDQAQALFLMQERKRARMYGDYYTSDSIRLELTNAGYMVMDKADGTSVLERSGFEIASV